MQAVNGARHHILILADARLKLQASPSRAKLAARAAFAPKKHPRRPENFKKCRFQAEKSLKTAKSDKYMLSAS